MKTFIALACLALVGCPTTNTPGGDASVDRDAPAVDAAAAPCMPEGTWVLAGWVGDPGNARDCVTPEAVPLAFGSDGVPIASDGNPLMCPATCDATTCSVVPVSGPTCTGSLRIVRACSGGPGSRGRFVIRGETADFEAELLETTCIFRTSASRAR